MTDAESARDSCVSESTRGFQKAFNRYPFEVGSLPFDHSQMTYIEISKGSKPYNLVLQYIAANSVDAPGVSAAKSFQDPNCDEKDDCNDCADDDEESDDEENVPDCVGLGLFAVQDEGGNLIYALHQRIGDPVGTSCGISFFTNLVLFSTLNVTEITKFLKKLVANSEMTKKSSFQCFKWQARHEYWRSCGSCRARSIESVVLPELTKSKLLNDISRFLSPATKKFYMHHGIPYRRSYLFYGVPGAGKTSLISAVAGHFQRNVSFLQLTDDEMNDGSLLSSIQRLTKNSIVVLEDIDSCFSKDRKNKIQHSKVTFSGLLNALDGVGSASGQIFILTTNLREELDPALIRCGRVDVQIEFTHIVDEQILKMWYNFYPDSDEMLAQRFLRTLNEKLGDKKLNAASLQHFFVLNMHNSPEEAIATIEPILEDLAFADKMKAELASEAAAAKEAATETEKKSDVKQVTIVEDVD